MILNVHISNVIQRVTIALLHVAKIHLQHIPTVTRQVNSVFVHTVMIQERPIENDIGQDPIEFVHVAKTSLVHVPMHVRLVPKRLEHYYKNHSNMYESIFDMCTMVWHMY
jgi:hypothetical protein